MRSVLFVCILFLAFETESTAQIRDSLKVSISYVVDASSADTHHENHVSIRQMQDSLTYLKEIVKAEFVEVDIVGCSSPEGRSERNKELSIARAMTLLHIFGLDSLDKSRIKITPKIVTWQEISNTIEAETWKYSSITLPIMIRGDLSENQKEWRLRQLGIDIWKDLDKEYLSRSRYATMIVKYVKAEPVKHSCDSLRAMVPIDTVAKGNGVLALIPIEEETPPVINESVSSPRPPFNMSIKTNALGLVAGLANFGFEVGLGKFSLDVPVQYSPYTFASRYNTRFLSIQPEFRMWLGEEAMNGGHFLGIHGHAVGFNVRLGDSMRYQDPNRAAWGVGFGYGYQLPPLGKNDKLMVELNIGAGYANILYDVYDEGGTGWYLYTGHRHWVGITRIGIKLSYKFDFNTNMLKEVAEK